MYPLQPSQIYALESLQEDPRCVKRIERVLQGCGQAGREVVWINPGNIADVAQELQGAWPPANAPADVPVSYLRPLVFTRVHTGAEPPPPADEVLGWPEGTASGTVAALLGHFDAIQSYHPYERDWKENRVCWPTFDFGTMTGCPHACQYCGTGKHGQFLNVAANIEEFMEVVVPRAVAQWPWQKCFRMMGWGADAITFEPEYGCIDLYTQTLAKYDRYGYFHTASSNVDWIADLPRKDRLIAIFSVTTEAIARELEGGTGHAFDRFEAGKRLNAMGVPVRYKFKPTLPIANWREEYARAIEYALQVSDPESIGFCVIMWMSLEQVGALVPLEMLDQEYVQAARDAAAEMEGNVCAPFPHHVRKEIYQHLIRECRRWSDDVLLYISTESREMWDELKDELGQNPNAFFCGCSSVAVPGRKLSLSPGCPHSTYTQFAPPADQA